MGNLAVTKTLKFARVSVLCDLMNMFVRSVIEFYTNIIQKIIKFQRKF